jgi:hypothetical protein
MPYINIDPHQILANVEASPGGWSWIDPTIALLISRLHESNDVGPVQATTNVSTGINQNTNQNTGRINQNTGPNTDPSRPANNTIPPAPALSYSWTPEYRTNAYVYSPLPGSPPQPVANLLTRESAEGLARLLGGRVVNTGGQKGPFLFPDTWDIELPDGTVVSSTGLAMYWNTAQRTWDQAMRDYELNRQSNPALFTHGPGFVMPSDPLTEVKNMIERDRSRGYYTNFDRVFESTPANAPTTQTMQGTQTGTIPSTQTTTNPITTTNRTWYNFYRLDNPLGNNIRQSENTTSPGVQRFGNNVVNAQDQGVPLGSPATSLERVTETTATGGQSQTGTSTINLGPKQSMNTGFVQDPNDIAGLWQRSWQMYGGSPDTESDTVVGPTVRPDQTFPAFFSPWSMRLPRQSGQVRNGPVRQGYSTTFNPYGMLPF